MGIKINKKITFLLIVILFLVYTIGLFTGLQFGERLFVQKMAIVFGGSDFDIDIDINETLLAEKVGEQAKDRFKKVLEEEFDKRNLVCKTCEDKNAK